MGCGSSKGTNTGGARNDNPPIESINVKDIDPNYPAPRPPPNNKDTIYKPDEYKSIDTRVTQNKQRANTSTYETLINSITTGCTTDLQKLRAIFVWLYLQDIHGSFYSGVNDPYTPRGYMKLIKTSDGSYASFFALLCRAADIPCNVVRGVAKGDKYEVGQQDMTRLESAWNAVYIEGGWRFIHPLWAYFQEKQTWEDGRRPPAGTKRSSIHEFFWLTDPNRMICFCKPHSDPWQLLKTKWEHKKFVKSPQFTEDYFSCGLMLPKKYNAIVYSDNGICVIDFDHDKFETPALEADVRFNQEMSSDEMPSNVRMQDYMTKASSSTRKSIVIRFPVRGRYDVDIYGGMDSRNLKLVEFRLECEDVGRNPKPFPVNPPEGFGILPIASQFGISDLVPDYGIVLVAPAQQKHFSFTSTEKLEVDGTLIHSTVSSDTFSDHIQCNTTDYENHVKVAVPDEEQLEFCLQIGVRPANASRTMTVVANYLLVDENWRKRTAAVSPRARGVTKNDEERIRKALIAATHKNDIAKLENAIKEFEHNGLVDNGDLTRARHKLLELHLQNLRKTTRERKLDELEKAVVAAKSSNVSADLMNTTEMINAETTLRQLKRLKLYMHKVLALNKATISEIHSYQRPRPLVHKVMKATFRILGEPNSRIQDWSYIQTGMRTLGKNSMLSRMRRCDVVHLKKTQINDAERYLGETNKHLVRMCSAGAGTFYVWSNNMISEYQGKGEVDPLQIWGSPRDKWASNKPKNKSNQNTPRIEEKPATPRDNDKRNSFHDDWDPNASSTYRDEDDWDPNK